ncbi:glycosyltransferase [Pseudooceanicola atlanticus]|uniref:Curdlan synthase n=1 Tax=Pseudooceanicola atlanticus TaxID=1461694 RepID=A0A0A0EKA1_9RHOB|nr:cellulose synthase catalytic subunit [Pseudooceanicola atlanticus]KGM50598.1 Curdlan synthase [Pseudooceanicola atlanticus]
MPPLYLSEAGSSVLHLLPVLGAALILPGLVNPRSGVQRTALFVIAMALSLRYLWWRATETIAPLGLTVDWAASWSLFAMEFLAMIGSFSAFIIMMRYRDRGEEATRNAGWWGSRAEPHVVLMIATYNEELEVLERTIIGAKALRHKSKEILVLDDGRRDWLQDFCAAQGVGYMRRPDNLDAKAGNINHALARLSERTVPPDFVAVLDADFVPHRGFISRSLALFHDPSVGLVQTPQHFFNADPIQHNLGISETYPDEQRFFFDHMQPSRDGWGIAFCCGTSSVIRFSALKDIGGFPRESVTEDFMLTLALQNGGWRTVYLNEALTEGLAPEGLKEYVTQRARWCLGLMQIARSSLGPLRRNGLRLRDRWSVLDSVFYWLTTFPFRLAAVIYPLLYWFFNITVVDARLPDVISYFGTYYLWTLLVLNLLSRGTVVPLLNDVSQLIGAWPITRAAVTGLLWPNGHPFSVTAKGGDRSKVVVQWRMMRFFGSLLALTLIGLVLGLVFDRFAFNDAGDGKWVILFWTIYNLFVLIICSVACVELPRRERHVADRPERVSFAAAGKDRPVWLASLTMDSARLRGHRYEIGTEGVVTLDEVGPVRAEVKSQTEDGVRLALRPDLDQREALMLRLHATDNTPGIVAVRLSEMVSDIARRFSFHSGSGH